MLQFIIDMVLLPFKIIIKIFSGIGGIIVNSSKNKRIINNLLKKHKIALETNNDKLRMDIETELINDYNWTSRMINNLSEDESE